MSQKNILINTLAITFAATFPHLGLTPLNTYIIPILLMIYWLLKRDGEKFSDIGFKLKSLKAKHLLFGALSAFLIIAFMQLLFFPVLDYFFVLETSDHQIYDTIRESKSMLIIMISMAWIIGAFYEQIVFHGFIFTRLKKMISGNQSERLAFLFTSIIFGLYHLQLGYLDTLNAFMVGIVYLGLVVYFKGNLWASIISHGVYNTTVMILIYYGYISF